MNLSTILDQLPETPGVYMMKDSLNNVIYVGKSNNIKKRVKQYFYQSSNHSPKIVDLVKNITDIKYIITDTELDALLLECELIKNIKPLYNSLMKNDLGYPYLKVTTSEEYPELQMVLEITDDCSRYFGPFTNKHTLEKAVTYLQRRFPVKMCNISSGSKKRSGCLNHHLGYCLGVCKGNVSKEEYRNWVKRLILLLENKDKYYLTGLEKEMLDAAEKLHFEKAARCRDEISYTKYLLFTQQIVDNAKIGRNFLAVEPLAQEKYKVFFIQGNKVLHKQIFDTSLSPDNLLEVLTSLIFEHFQKPSQNYQIFDQKDLDEARIIANYMRHKKKKFFSCKIPNTWLQNTNLSKLNSSLNKLVKFIY